jgi:hypothetical protein
MDDGPTRQGSGPGAPIERGADSGVGARVERDGRIRSLPDLGRFSAGLGGRRGQLVEHDDTLSIQSPAEHIQDQRNSRIDGAGGDKLGGACGDRAEQPLMINQSPFSEFSGRYVARHAPEAAEFALVVETRNSAHLEPDFLPVLGQERDFIEAERRPLLEPQ